MDKVFCDKKIKELEAQEEGLLEKLNDVKKRFKEIYNEELYNHFVNILNNKDYNYVTLVLEAADRLQERHPKKLIVTKEEIQAGNKLRHNQYLISCYKSCYLDKGWMQMEGDIVITDPCYLMPDYYDDFSKRDEYVKQLYEMLDKYGLYNETLYGDWNCTTFNMDTKLPIGEFCADSGMVCIVPLKAIQEYNPEFDNGYLSSHAVTFIKNFKGQVKIEIIDLEGKENAEDFVVEVVGEGNINFRTSQTGL